MGNRKKKLAAAMFAAWMILIWMSGCEDTQVTTDIRADGSCRRTVVVKSGSEDVFDTAYPVPRDESWQIFTEWTKENTPKRFVYSAEKDFESVGMLAQEVGNQHPLDSRLEISLDREWKGFFVHYRYREIYHDVFPFKKPPLSDFFSEGELDLIHKLLAEEEHSESTESKEREKILEEKFKQWYARATFEEYFAVFSTAVSRMERPEITAQDLDTKKEALYDKAFASVELMEKIKWEPVLEATGAIFGEDAVRRVVESAPEDFANYQNKFKIIESLMGDEFTHTVRMPGAIVSANTEILDGDTATWKFAATNFLFQNYEMVVESRKLNMWVIGGTGALFFVLGIWLLVSASHKRAG